MNLENASDSVVKLDRMRYTKDTLSANLILAAIVLDCLYFVKLYQLDVSNYYYTWWTGASVIYNLVFMLAAFLCSENVKSRKTNLIGLQVVLAVMQFVRIFHIPANARDAFIVVGDQTVDVMTNDTYTYLIAMLIVSGACLAIAAVTSLVSSKKLGDYMKSLETKSA